MAPRLYPRHVVRSGFSFIDIHPDGSVHINPNSGVAQWDAPLVISAPNRRDITATQFGGNRYGNVDNSQALYQLASQLIADGGGEGILPDGEFLFTDFVKLTNVTVPLTFRGAGKGRTVIYKNQNSDWQFQVLGQYGPQVSLTADADAGLNVLTVADTSTMDLSIGDLVKFGANAVVYTEGLNTAYVGQMSEVVGLTSTTITIKDAFYTNFLVSDSAWVQKVTPAPHPRFLDMTFIDLDQSSTGQWGFVEVGAGSDVEVDVDGQYANHAAIYLIDAYHFHVRTKATDYADDLANNRPGYGVAPYAASCFGEVDVTMARGRHAFTTGNYQMYGEPQNIQVTGRAHGNTAMAFDTHPPGWNILFKNVIVFGCQSAGLSFRSPGCHAIGGIIDNCPLGVWLAARANDASINGTKITNIPHVFSGSLGSAGTGIYIVAGAGYSIARVAIDGVRIQDTYREAIYMDSSVSYVNINGANFHNIINTRGVSFPYTAAVHCDGASHVNVNGATMSDDTGQSMNSIYLVINTNGGSANVSAHNIANGMSLMANSSGTFAEGVEVDPNGLHLGGNVIETFASTLTLDPKKGAFHSITLTGNVTSSTMGTAPVSMPFTLVIIQDSAGGHTIALPSNWVLPASYTPNTTANKRDILTMYYDGSAGKWYPISVLSGV